MNYYAHTLTDKNEDEWHLLSAHLLKTGEIASSFAHIQAYKEIFRIAGYLHDLGKYQPAFQKYLKEGGRRGSVPHAKWGAGYSILLNNPEISLVIDGHHKGLPDKASWNDDINPFRYHDVPDFDKIIEVHHNDVGLEKAEISAASPTFENVLERELFIRYLYSSLTDADWLDTEGACSPDVSSARIHSFLDYDDLITKIEIEIQSKPKDGELNLLRNQARESALSKAEMPPGFYSLNLPTGMGKTLTSVLWALMHGKKNSLKRIIIVLPFINIIDQTASILKNIFGKENVLEHHSGIADEISISENIQDDQYSRRLACENWEFPVIVTTTVQFFESLFSNRPSKCRKIHNIAESIVIFDEVQTLPKNIVLPTLTMLKNISSIMGTSLLFCTATLPAFEKREKFQGIENIVPLVEEPGMLFDKTRRVSYISVNDYNPIDFQDLVDLSRDQNSSILAVFNTKKSAREFYNQAAAAGPWEKYCHLSTGMCPAHRKSVIHEIREDLNMGRKIFVSSTQLIEAGVDFDFPCVFRECAPLESIIQSAGRCNREGLMNELGKVYLFRLTDSGMPDKQYWTASEFALELIKDNRDNLYKHDFYNEYYKRLIQLFVDPDKNMINAARENFNFETVSNSYHIIENRTRGLFIYLYSEESKSLLDSINQKQYLNRDDCRKMQNYIVQVYENFIINNYSSISNTHHGLLVWNGGYDEKTGIEVDPLTSDQLVV